MIMEEKSYFRLKNLWKAILTMIIIANYVTLYVIKLIQTYTLFHLINLPSKNLGNQRLLIYEVRNIYGWNLADRKKSLLVSTFEAPHQPISQNEML